VGHFTLLDPDSATQINAIHADPDPDPKPWKKASESYDKFLKPYRSSTPSPNNNNQL
jgi:hypothetical protein